MTIDSYIQPLWSRLEAWLEKQAPQLLAALQPGASEAQIKAAEEAMGIEFPDDFKASCRIHDGESGERVGLILGREFLPLERIQEEWKIWKELLDKGTFEGIDSQPRGHIRNDWWNPAWIPITSNACGDNECLDLAPVAGGQQGQVITMWHDDSDRIVEAPSFSRWLEEFVLKCESGQYVYNEEEEGLVEADDAGFYP